MSQHIINCPKCGNQHEVDAFRKGGVANAIFTIGNAKCNFSTEDIKEVRKLLGIEEVHRQRIKWSEMPSRDY